MKLLRSLAVLNVLAMTLYSGNAVAQNKAVVKIGQIEAQTGPNAIYGWMSSQGVPMAVQEINKAGGFKIGDITYTLELQSMDTRGDPKEATIQLKQMIERENIKYVFGPFLSNVFVTILPYAKQFNNKFLLMGGAGRMHDFVGQPGNEFLVRTWNWDTGTNGFGEQMVDYLVEKAKPKRVAMLWQNDQGGRVLAETYAPIFAARGIETMTEFYEPNTKDFTPVLARISAFAPDYLVPGYTDAPLYDIVRQAVEGNYIKKFFMVRGSIGPGLKSKDGIEDYIVYVPKYFEEAEKTNPKVKSFIEYYKAFHKRDFPYDQAPLCSSSCYDHVYMLVEAMKKAGSVDDVTKVREALLSMTYNGLWTIKYEKAEAVFAFDIVRLTRGGGIEVTQVVPK